MQSPKLSSNGFGLHYFKEADIKLISDIDKKLTSFLQLLPGVKSITIHNLGCYESIVRWSIQGEYEGKHYSFMYIATNALGIESNTPDQIKHNPEITKDMLEDWLQTAFESNQKEFKCLRELMNLYCEKLYTFFKKNKKYCEEFYKSKYFIEETLRMIKFGLNSYQELNTEKEEEEEEN